MDLDNKGIRILQLPPFLRNSVKPIASEPLTSLSSYDYFEVLQSHRVPTVFPALVAMQDNPRAMDVYCWLSYRLPRAKAPTRIAYRNLHPVFGHGIRLLKHFKITPFGRTLALDHHTLTGCHRGAFTHLLAQELRGVQGI